MSSLIEYLLPTVIRYNIALRVFPHMKLYCSFILSSWLKKSLETCIFVTYNKYTLFKKIPITMET